MPRPDTKKRGKGGRGGTGDAPRTARVPPPAASNPHRTQREGLPAFEHRREVLAAIAASQVCLCAPPFEFVETCVLAVGV